MTKKSDLKRGDRIFFKRQRILGEHGVYRNNVYGTVASFRGDSVLVKMDNPAHGNQCELDGAGWYIEDGDRWEVVHPSVHAAVSNFLLYGGELCLPSRTSKRVSK